jgi:hypothetical protein
MPHMHWVARQNKLELPNDEEEVLIITLPTLCEKKKNFMGRDKCLPNFCQVFQ